MSVTVSSLAASHLNSYLQNQLVNQTNPHTVRSQFQPWFPVQPSTRAFPIRSQVKERAALQRNRDALFE